MKYANNIAAIDELSASEGVFTTAQAQRLGISRNASPTPARSGASSASPTARIASRCAEPETDGDELAAIWKLTASTAFSWERQAKWDGVAVGGSTAAWLLGIGDFHLSPYRIYAPERINSKIESARFGVRNVDEGDMAWIGGLPVTRAERTLADLCLDCEDPSLVEGAFRDAAAQGLIDPAKLGGLLDELGENKRRAALLEPLARALSASDQKGRYRTPAALEMAVKEAAKKSPLDTNRAIAGFYFHRLLCRVFSDPDSPFVLKGSQSVLAQTVGTREGPRGRRCVRKSMQNRLTDPGRAGCQ